MSLEYNFQHIHILLVEDNVYVRRILDSVLRQLTVGGVTTAINGVDAIEQLKSSGAGVAGGSRFDIIISDMVMAPIDGLLLLKWVRESRDSPNRFMPFIMMSGAADDINVQKARDQGINEFLAKPFSAVAVCERLLQLIDQPRQFVATTAYFGPDRHRRREGHQADDRRETTEDDATVVYSSDRVVRPKEPDQVYYFRLPNRLREKAGGAGAKGKGSLPVQALDEADGTLQRNAFEFHDWAQDYLSMMSRICDKALELPEEKRRKAFEKINEIAHELRGQGGTFGYPLITSVGKMLYGITGFACSMDDMAIRIVKAHIDVMRVVFRDQVSGDGGEIGRELIKTLIRAIRQEQLGGSVAE
ncbi:MAG: response regulator [Rhodospirillales bacterium]|nr:response regulator [Rhodospirillales bacterium]